MAFYSPYFYQMKVVLAQQNYHVGNFEDNLSKIIDAIKFAKKANADLIVFSEMCICGYPARDFLDFDDFINKCYESLEKIKQFTDTIGVIVGAPDRNAVKEGKDLFNAAFFLYQKEIKSITHKTCLPNYDVFDEYRYFEPAYNWNTIEFKGKRIALTICEDIWNLGDNPLYRICPMDILMKQDPDFMINISASPFDYTHAEDRKATIKSNVLKYKIPIIYCNAVGSQTEIIFDGVSLCFDKDANLCWELSQFKEELKEVILNDDGTFGSDVMINAREIPDQLLEPVRFVPSLNISQVYNAIVLGIKDYFSKMGFTRAIVGSSGGIDSAVTISLACEALGKENVRAVLMPSEFSTSHSVSDAEILSKNLGNQYDIISIRNIYREFLSALKPVFEELPFNVAEENIQARSRGVLLMALANKFGYVLLNTSNKSELAVGYGTLYGDMAGGLSVLGDCYKQQVYELAKFINSEKEIIPSNILQKAPSAELKPGQKDVDSLPPYEILDQILYQYIERIQGPVEIKALDFEGPLVDRILKMVNKNEYKRNQFCPIIRISPKAFGTGRRMPIVGNYLN
ncbi:MAG: NAD+ synthase [Ginsengibacter sp.]